MQDSRGCGTPARSGHRDEIYRAVVLELALVIDRIRKSRKQIESAITSDAAGEDMAADDVIVLDDVTAGYERGDAALWDCDAGLSIALRLLQGPMISNVSAWESSLTPAHLPISA